MPNAELLRETMDAVLAAVPAGRHEQMVWCSQNAECETAGCFAGWRAILDGYTEYREIYVEDEGIFNALVNPKTGDALVGDGIGDYARRRLGLHEIQADDLFWMFNSLEALKHKVDLLCEDPW